MTLIILNRNPDLILYPLIIRMNIRCFIPPETRRQKTTIYNKSGAPVSSYITTENCTMYIFANAELLQGCEQIGGIISAPLKSLNVHVVAMRSRIKI
jgi:hypothetical protein